MNSFGKPHYYAVGCAAALVICLLVVMPVARPAKENHAEHKMSWTAVTKEVPDTGFSPAFIDSLKAAFKYQTVAPVRIFNRPLSKRYERFVVEVGWGPINAGFGVIDFKPDSAKKIMTISVKGATNDFTSSFLKVRDYIASTVDITGGYPLFFQEHIEEGKYRSKRWVLFDPAQGTVFCHKKEMPVVKVNDITGDFLSILYVVRGMSFAPGDTFTLRCFIDGKDGPIFFKIGKRKRVNVRAGAFDCILVEPRLIGKGRNFTENDKVSLWMTDDEAHLPIEIRSKVKVGSIVAELIYFE